jgi:hypothetical protein
MLRDEVGSSATSQEPVTHRPLGRYGQLEVDAFCAGCGYNLHGQEVSMDERLAFLVCRCPECGRFHPAGANTSANSVWVSRLGTILLVVWIGVVLAMTAVSMLGFAGLQAGYIGTFTYFRSANGPQNFNGPWFISLDPDPGTSEMNIPGNGVATILISIAAAVGFLVGTMLVAFLWHWPPRRYLLVALVVPTVPAAIVMWSFLDDRKYEHIRQWCVSRTWMIAAVQMGGMLLAIRFGRPLARAIVRTIIPPKPRQLLAFLWRADGKTMPAMKTTAV